MIRIPIVGKDINQGQVSAKNHKTIAVKEQKIGWSHWTECEIQVFATSCTNFQWDGIPYKCLLGEQESDDFCL